MQKTILSTAALLLAMSASVVSYAQNTEKKEGDKTTTVGTWRDALPPGTEQQDAPPVVVMAESRDNVEAKETPAQIEKRILDLEQKLMQALKLRDAASLDNLIADDFMFAGLNVAASAQPDKARFIGWATKNLELKSYNLEKSTVRVYPSTVVVTLNYKRQATVSGASADGDFTVTDVWVRRAKRWQAVSHHVSQTPKP